LKFISNAQPKQMTLTNHTRLTIQSIKAISTLILIIITSNFIIAQSNSSLLFSGYIDSYYQYNFNDPLEGLNGG